MPNTRAAPSWLHPSRRTLLLAPPTTPLQGGAKQAAGRPAGHAGEPAPPVPPRLSPPDPPDSERRVPGALSPEDERRRLQARRLPGLCCLFGFGRVPPDTCNPRELQASSVLRLWRGLGGAARSHCPPRAHPRAGSLGLQCAGRVRRALVRRHHPPALLRLQGGRSWGGPCLHPTPPACSRALPWGLPSPLPCRKCSFCLLRCMFKAGCLRL